MSQLWSILNIPEELARLLVGQSADGFKVTPRDNGHFVSQVLHSGFCENFFFPDAVCRVSGFFEKGKDINTPL